jgi:hypothetical protein
MSETHDIIIYNIVSITDLHKHFPALRNVLFGMSEANVLHYSCTINEFGHITFLDKEKHFGKVGSSDRFSEQEVKSTSKEIIDTFNKKVADSYTLQKEKFPPFIQQQFLKPPIITKAVNPFTQKFDHYVITHGFIVRPLSSQDFVPVFDATVELRIDGSKNLIGFFYKWRPVISSFLAKRYKIYIQENKPNINPDLSLEEAQLGYKFEDDKDKLLPYYLGLSNQQSFFIPASEYSDKNSSSTKSPLSISSDKWIKSDYNEILKKEKFFEIAVALRNHDPNKVEGWADFKKGGQYYNPFKWYNYKINEQPEKPNSNSISQGQQETLSEISGFVFYNTVTGKKLWDLLSKSKQFNTRYNPPEYLIRQMLSEAKKVLFVPNTQLGKLIVGNFDFIYDGYKCVVLVRFKFKLDGDVDKAIEPLMRQRFFDAVATYWTNSGYGLVKDNNSLKDFIPIFIYLQEVADEKSAHKIVHVHNSILLTDNRPFVADEINLLSNSNVNPCAHEFGHALGNYDEYDSRCPNCTVWEKITGWTEQQMFWKENQYNSDKSALMNIGKELRDRYFQHYLNAVQEFDATNNYQLGRLQTN